MTDAMSAGRFPLDEPLNAVGNRQLDCLELTEFDRAVCAPELRAQQTAERLGLQAGVVPALAELNVDAWQGKSLDEVDPGQLGVWLTDPTAAPHGGESIVNLVVRVGRWLDLLAESSVRIVAVTHPAVIRSALLAALDAPPQSFWRIDIAPASRVVLHHRAAGWTLRV